MNSITNYFSKPKVKDGEDATKARTDTLMATLKTASKRPIVKESHATPDGKSTNADAPPVKKARIDDGGEADKASEKPVKAEAAEDDEEETVVNTKKKKKNAMQIDDDEEEEEDGEKKEEKKADKSDTPKNASEPVKEVKKEADTSKEVKKETPASKPASTLSFKKSGGRSLSNYDVVGGATWKRGEPVPYSALANVFKNIEATKKRLEITRILADFLRTVIVTTPDDLVACIYLTLNKLAPAYEGVELGIGESILIKAVADATGRTVAKVKELLQSTGDLGEVAEQSRGKQQTMFKPKKLTVRRVFKDLRWIADVKGNDSQAAKKGKIKVLLVACEGVEARYLIRSLGGKLRISLAEQTLLVALARAFTLTPKQVSEEEAAADPKLYDTSIGMSEEKFSERMCKSEEIIKQAFSELPNYDKMVGVLLEDGVLALPEKCFLTPGVPVKPMLAKPTRGVGEVLTRFENCPFTCEYKYDGERAQIHYTKEKGLSIYSRNSENNTLKYPDLVPVIEAAINDKGVESFVIDSEVVAYDFTSQKILPFQILSTRSRKVTDMSTIKVNVCIYAFDLLYLNGKSYLKEPFRKRRDTLYDNFHADEGKFMFAVRKDAADPEKIEEFLHEAVKGNCEGLMVKTLDTDATYEPAKRSLNWLKVKKDYLDGLTDSLDLVPIGAFYGKGKRKGVYGAYLLAAYDPDNEEYQSICKIGTGFSDELLTKHHAFFSTKTLAKPPSYYTYGSSVEPDVWFEACQVWEVMAADLSISPTHKAAIGEVDDEKGIALRFPRFMHIREDKGPEEATTSTQVADMYRSQDLNVQTEVL